MKAVNDIRFPRLLQLRRSAEERQFDTSNQFRLNQNFRSIVEAVSAVEDSVSGLSENILSQIPKPADYVTAYGTDGIWTYRKWNSGAAECWGSTLEIQKNITTANGALYSETQDIALPSGFFTETDGAFLAAISGSVCLCSVSALTEETLTAFVCSTITGLIPLKICAHVLGRWK